MAQVTLADSDLRRARDVAVRVNLITGEKKVRPTAIEASNEKAASKLMRGHDAAMCALPYYFNEPMARAALEGGCHFADLGGNTEIVIQQKKLHPRAASLIADFCRRSRS